MYTLLPPPRGSSQSLTKGLTGLRDAALYMIIGTLLYSVTLVLLIFSLIPLLILSAGGIMSILAKVPFGITIPLTIIGVVITLYALYGKLIPSSKDLSDFDPELTSAAMLIKIGYLWGLILILVGIVTILILIGIVIMIIGLIFLLVGQIGISIMMFKLNSSIKETMFLVAGILFIAGLFFPLATFVGWILVYVGANSVLIRQSTYYLEKKETRPISSTTMRCPYCGSEIPADSKRCPVCGLEIPSS
jgi:MFS family permease